MQDPGIADEPAFTVVGLHATFVHIFSPDVTSGEGHPARFPRSGYELADAPDSAATRSMSPRISFASASRLS
jgi:hypothetical protein